MSYFYRFSFIFFIPFILSSALVLNASWSVDDTFLETLAARDRAYVSIDGVDDPGGFRCAYTKYFYDDDKSMIENLTGDLLLDLKTLSRANRVRLFAHILNCNIRKIYETLPEKYVNAEGDFSASGEVFKEEYIFETYDGEKGSLEDYFDVTSKDIVEYKGKKIFKAKFGLLRVEITANPSPSEHGGNELVFTKSGGSSIESSYTDLVDSWDADKKATALECLRSTKKYYAIKVAGVVKKIRIQQNVLLIRSEVDMARRLVYKFGSKEYATKELIYLPVVSIVSMAATLDDLVDFWEKTTGKDREGEARRIVSAYFRRLPSTILG